MTTHAPISFNFKEVTPHNPISTIALKKNQKWDASVMANIWAKRKMLDPTQLSYIKALYDNAKSNGRYNESTFTYSYSKNSAISRAGFGRMYSQEKGSLERLEKTLRHALCAKLYWDIDVTNAQPSILSQIAKRYGLKLDFLTYYEKNRNEVIKKIMAANNMSRDEVKEWIIKCIFGCKIPELSQLQKELKSLANEMRSDFSELYDLIVKTKEKNIVGTFLAYVAQTEECRCLIAMNDYFTRNSRYVSVLCYDGCMINKLDDETSFPEDLLRGCEKYIKDVTGYDLKLQVKEMKCPEEFSNPSTKLLRMSDVDDVYMAKKFIAKMGDNLINDTDQGIMVFQPEIGFWSNDVNDIRREIVNAELIEETMDGVVNYSGFLYKEDIVIKLLPALVLPVKFCENNIDRTIGKLLFKNGIYDMASKTFTKSFDRNLYFAGRIDRDFPETRNEELILKVNKLLFKDPFKPDEHDVGVYQKQLIARAIAGHYHDKFMIFAVGETNSGKGVQSLVLEKCFGSFVSSYSPNALLYNKNSGADEAKKLSWIYAIHNSRISIGNEVRVIGIIDSSILKVLISGGDLIPIRKNFKDEEYRKNRCILTYFCNDIPRFDTIDNAIIERIKLYEYKLTFVNKPIDQLEEYERSAIPIKTLFEDDEYKNAYFWCIMDAYLTTIPVAPLTAINSMKDWIPAPKASFISCLKAAGYEIIKGDESAFTPYSELEMVLSNGGVINGMSKQAIGRELTKLGTKSDTRDIEGKNIKIRLFIKKIDSSTSQNTTPSL